jgi:hypothetical protein
MVAFDRRKVDPLECRAFDSSVEKAEDIGRQGANVETLRGCIEAVDKAIEDETEDRGDPGT